MPQSWTGPEGRLQVQAGSFGTMSPGGGKLRVQWVPEAWRLEGASNLTGTNKRPPAAPQILPSTTTPHPYPHHDPAGRKKQDPGFCPWR